MRLDDDLTLMAFRRAARRDRADHRAVANGRGRALMPVLIIGAAERAKIAAAVAYAKAHPILFSVLREGAVSDKEVVRLQDRKPGFERPASQHIEFPGGYRASYSVEQQPAGMCSHLSISVFGRAKPGRMPSVEAIKMIAQAFGVPFPADRMWSEEFDPGEFAVNLLHLYAPTVEGNA